MKKGNVRPFANVFFSMSDRVLIKSIVTPYKVLPSLKEVVYPVVVVKDILQVGTVVSGMLGTVYKKNAVGGIDFDTFRRIGDKRDGDLISLIHVAVHLNDTDSSTFGGILSSYPSVKTVCIGPANVVKPRI